MTVVFPPPISGATKLYTPTKPETTATFCTPRALSVTTPPPAGPPRALRSSTLQVLATSASRSPVNSPAKHAFLKDGIGWGGMPLHMVEKDIASGALVVLNVDDVPPSGFMLTMSAYHRASEPPGPAGRWLIDHLKDSWEQLSCPKREL